jgi:hypothetical protein
MPIRRPWFLIGEKSRPFARLVLVRRVLAVLLAIPLAASAARVEYVGGTSAQFSSGEGGRLEVADDHYLAFYSKKSQVRVPYDRINLLEYGQQVDRRLAMAVVISPLFLLSKKRKHFLTVGYADEQGKQQALVFRVDKSSIRATLVSLEARTGLKIQYQDEEARKAGKG